MCACKCLSSLNREGIAALNRGDWFRATELLGQALRKADALGAEVLQAKVRNNLGLVMQAQGMDQEAAAYFRFARAQVAKRVGTDNRLYARICDNLAKVSELESPCSAAEGL